MATRFGIEQLLDAIKYEREGAANAIKEQVKQELKVLENIKHIDKKGKTTIKVINDIISLISKTDFESVKKKYIEKVETVKNDYTGHLREYLKVNSAKLKEIKEVEQLPDGNPQPIGNTSNLKEIDNKTNKRPDIKPANTNQNTGKHVYAEQPRQGSQMQSNHSIQETSERNNMRAANTNQEFGKHESAISRQRQPGDGSDIQGPDKSTAERTEYRNQHTSRVKEPSQEVECRGTVDDEALEQIQRDKSKRASQAMRMNNPNIADLSDTNRPTKTAERFSELYDNEWTEAFEELRGVNMKERDIIEHLLRIVKNAYTFCSDQAKKNVDIITQALCGLLQFGTQEYLTEARKADLNGVPYDDNRGLIVQYHKEIADKALPRLQKGFKEKCPQLINKQKQLRGDLKRVNLYAMKAVELTWWMCVQDPPIYMCPTDDGGKDESLTNLYKAYTKTGTRIDFFVWPALRLYKDGGVLIKGVVQYK